ncbi:MAG: NnrU family protein [Cypionkella sp.]|nr:NnrU family protein [Cypionkella sp.]
MTLLILGLALWIFAHGMKRLTPALHGRLGAKAKPVVALAVVLSVVLMVIGYRTADGAVFWGRSPALVGINNLLMVLAFYVYAVGGPKGARIWLGTKLRHPQLVGFSIWAGAHLLVNGDSESIILFGGLLAWALGTIALINAQDGVWTPPARAPRKKEFIYVGAAIAGTLVVMVMHNYLGVQPWA